MQSENISVRDPGLSPDGTVARAPAARTIIVGISGASGSGKTLVAKTILTEAGAGRVCLLGEDAYYRNLDDIPAHLRERRNFDHPDCLDHDLLCQHLAVLKSGGTVEIPQYDYATYQRLPNTTIIGGKSLILVEGILLFADHRLRDLLDIKIYIDTPLDICLLRRLRRDTVERGRNVETVMHQYEETVRPMYLQFIEPSKRYADLIVPRGGKNRIAIDLIKTKLVEFATVG